jgi:hypothetical protein
MVRSLGRDYGAGQVINPWFSLAYEATQLGFDAQRVIALRFMRLATGGASGQAEAHRMISEKPTALVEAQFAAAGALAGGSSAVATRKILAVYKKRVRANKRRLSRH